MSAALRGRAIGECTHHQMQVVRAKRKVVRMFVLVVMVFALCWLPYHAYFVLVYHHQRLASAPFAQHIYLGFYWLAMANSMFNPLIYYWMSNKFRVYFRVVLCFCKSSKSTTPHDMKKLELNKSFSGDQRNVLALLCGYSVFRNTLHRLVGQIYHEKVEQQMTADTRETPRLYISEINLYAQNLVYRHHVRVIFIYINNTKTLRSSNISSHTASQHQGSIAALNDASWTFGSTRRHHPDLVFAAHVRYLTCRRQAYRRGSPAHQQLGPTVTLHLSRLTVDWSNSAALATRLHPTRLDSPSWLWPEGPYKLHLK
ncbi:hypothetical protein evm_001725 [Chilo suppressalis]|nr:hypothetical protein evm_001725 [Chilo suppressalis]